MSVTGQQQGYGALNYPNSNPGSTGYQITGSSAQSGPSAGSDMGPSARGRVVGNSILDLDDEPSPAGGYGSAGSRGGTSSNQQSQQARPQLQSQPSQSPSPNRFQQPQPQSSGFVPSNPVMQRPSSGSAYGSSTSMERNPANPTSSWNDNRNMGNTGPSGSGSSGPSGSSSPSGNELSGTSNMGMGSTQQGQQSSSNSGPRVTKFVSVHVPVPEPVIPSRARPTQPTQRPDTHYQIVFIKAPSPSPQEQQEIQLPPPVEQKTLVYVLLKKPETNDVVKISQQPTRRPSRPEVYFIRYNKGDRVQMQRQPNSNNNNNNNSNNANNNNNSSNNYNNNTVNNVNMYTQQPRNNMNSNYGPPRPQNPTAMMRPQGSRSRGPSTSQQGGYGVGSAEIADSDFSSHESYNENEFSHSSFEQEQQQHRVTGTTSGMLFSASAPAPLYGAIR